MIARANAITSKALAAGFVAFSLGGTDLVLAQGMTGHKMPMDGMQHAAPSGEAAASPSTAGFQAAMDMMMRNSAPLTGNTDRDFAAQMIPHHQAAIDMAQLELQHGRDPEMRRLATEIITAQEREISQLKAFLARQPQG